MRDKLVTHALLRYYQFLRAPSALQDALARRAALGLLPGSHNEPRWGQLPVDLRRFLYRLAVERFEVEAAVDSWVARPVLALSRFLNAIEHRLAGLVGGGRAAKINGGLPGGLGWPDFSANAVDSIVRTLGANIDRISRLKILIRGQEADTLAGHLDLSIFFPVSQPEAPVTTAGGEAPAVPETSPKNALAARPSATKLQSR